MMQNQERRVQKMQLYYKAAKKYKKPTPAETGARLKYDVQELRLHPEKLQKRYQEQEQEAKQQEQNAANAAQGWGNYKEQLGKAMGGISAQYGKIKPTEPSWVLRLGEWGIARNTTTGTCLPKKKDVLQREISRKEKKLQKRTGRSQKLRFLREWQEAVEFLKNLKARPHMPGAR